MIKLYKSTRCQSMPVPHPDQAALNMSLRAVFKNGTIREFMMTAEEVPGLRLPVRVWHLTLATADARTAATCAVLLACSPEGRELLARRKQTKLQGVASEEHGGIFTSHQAALRWAGCFHPKK